MYEITPIDFKQLFNIVKMKEVFTMAVNHFRTQLFGIEEENVKKFDLILGYLYVTRKGVT